MGKTFRLVANAFLLAGRVLHRYRFKPSFDPRKRRVSEGSVSVDDMLEGNLDLFTCLFSSLRELSFRCVVSRDLPLEGDAGIVRVLRLAPNLKKLSMGFNYGYEDTFTISNRLL